jgi:hypothetical protein
MIDLFVAKGAVGSPQQHHRTRLASVTYSRFSEHKTKQTITYIDSPLTGAQMELTYWEEPLAGRPTAFVEIKLPLSTATIGQNYIHAGLESVEWEITCAALLCRLVLTTAGFNNIEIDSFMNTAETELVELTWHTATASPRAALKLQERAHRFFEARRTAKSRHDVRVKNVDVRNRNGVLGMLVETKSGDEFRQYGKYHQILAKSKRCRRRFAYSKEIEQRKGEAKALIETHVRNECRVQRETLKNLGALNPKAWWADPDLLRKAIAFVCDEIGLNARPRTAQRGKAEKLSPQAQVTWDRYVAGEAIKDILPPYTFSRHRKAILAAKGEDIDSPSQPKHVRGAAVGHQLQYDRRWKPTGDVRKLALCEETAPPIIEDLKRGIAYIATGEIPEFADEEAQAAWLKRWKHYAEQEKLCRPARIGHGPKKMSPPLRPRNTGRFACGVGRAPVIPGVVDELIFLDGEPIVI